MANPLKIVLGIDSKGFHLGIKQASEATEKFSQNARKNRKHLDDFKNGVSSCVPSLSSLAKSLAGVAGAYLSFNAVKNTLKESIEIAQKSEEATVRLNTIMDQIPKITDEAKAGVKDYCKELSQVTTIGNTAQKSGASQLASFQMSAESMKILMPELNNLAVANNGVNVTSEQMISCANLLGKAYTGMTGALSKSGIIMSDTQKKQLELAEGEERARILADILHQNFGDLAKQMANTSEGAMVRFRNSINGIKGDIGTALMPVLADFTSMIANKMPMIQEKVQGVIEKVKPILAQLIPKLKQGLTEIFNNLKSAYNSIQPMFKFIHDNFNTIATVILPVVAGIMAYQKAVAVATAVSKVWKAITVEVEGGQRVLNLTLSLNPVALIIGAVVGLIALLVLLYKRCEPFRNFVDGLWAKLKVFFQMVWQKLQEVWAKIVEFWNKIQPYVMTALSYIGDFIKRQIEIWKNVIHTIVDVVKTVIDWIKNAITNIANFFKNVKDGIVSIWNGVTSTIKSVINGIISVINGALSKIFGGINKLIDKINSVKNTLGGDLIGIPDIPSITAPQIPMLAKGGNVVGSGSVIVGERGPEMLNVPKGASVTPLSKTNNNNVVINVYAQDKSVSQIMSELVPQLKMAISNI